MQRLLTLLSLFLLAASPSFASSVDTQYLEGLGDLRYHLVESENVGRAFHIYVSLPDGYGASDDEYPTIYLLDGGALFPMLTAYNRYLMFGEEVPETIIVGISYGSESFEGGNYRSTDYTAPSEEREYWGGAETFQSFLSDELLPFIDGTYRSQNNRRIVFGQSIGGQFVLYTAQTEPELFWGHIASNPALHRNLPFFLEQHSITSSSEKPSRLFVGSGTHDDPRFREPALEWIEHWTSIENKPWALKTEDLTGHSHMSAPPVAFRQGMRWLFESQ